MNKINSFFFPLDEDEKLHPSDAIWFYGGITLFVGIALFTVLSAS